MKLVVFSDAHGDATTAGVDRYEDVARACEEVVEGAIRDRADLALFLGDLTDPDTSRSHRAVALLACVASDLRDAGIDFRAIVGNHDVVEDGRGTSTLSPLAGAGFVVHAEPAVEHLPARLSAGGAVYLPYPPRSKSHDPEAYVRDEGRRHFARDAPIVVAGHLMIRGADPGSESADLARGRDVFYPWEACREVFGPNALLLCGHYHRRQVAAGGIQIPGSLARLRFDEERHEPGYLVCESRPRAPWNVRFVRVKARRLWTVGPNSPAWAQTPDAESCFADMANRDAIFRVLPPTDATDEQIAAVKTRIERAGAAKVHVEPRASSPAVLLEEPSPLCAERRETPRQAVMALAEAARCEDRPALLAELDAVLTRQRL